MTAEAAAQTVAPSGEESYVAKLTVKTLGCNPSMVKTLPPEKTKMAIARIYGKAAETKYQEDKNNPGVVHTYFNGNFEGINLQDGTVLRSGKLFLPGGIYQVVEAAIKTAKDKDPKSSVSFAFEIRAVKASNPIGYSYEATALRNPHAEDELAEMRSVIAALPTHEEKLQLADKVQKGKTLEGTVGGRKSA